MEAFAETVLVMVIFIAIACSPGIVIIVEPVWKAAMKLIRKYPKIFGCLVLSICCAIGISLYLKKNK